MNETGSLSITTYDVADFFTNISREQFTDDLGKARERIRERYPNANFF